MFVIKGANYPRTRLKPECSLVEVDCYPKARVYFTSSEQQNAYLKESILNQKTSFSSANSTVLKVKYVKK